VNNDKESPKGSSDEAIGRPKAWREGRYQEPGKPVDRSVITPAGGENHDTVSTPVTRKDYEQAPPADRALAQWNIGTGGYFKSTEQPHG
jgi:hypothetical protein